eukprot:scaffold76160_cov30-Tisochrysis_lutea.AAC.8
MFSQALRDCFDCTIDTATSSAQLADSREEAEFHRAYLAQSFIDRLFSQGIRRGFCCCGNVPQEDDVATSHRDQGIAIRRKCEGCDVVRVPDKPDGPGERGRGVDALREFS